MKEENLFAHRWHEPFLFSFRVLFPGLLLRRGVDWPFEEAIWEHCPSLQGLQSPRTACTLQPLYNPSMQLFVLFQLEYPISLRKKEYHKTLFQWKSTEPLGHSFSCHFSTFMRRWIFLYEKSFVLLRQLNETKTYMYVSTIELITETAWNVTNFVHARWKIFVCKNSCD